MQKNRLQQIASTKIVDMFFNGSRLFQNTSLRGFLCSSNIWQWLIHVFLSVAHHTGADKNISICWCIVQMNNMTLRSYRDYLWVLPKSTVALTFFCVLNRPWAELRIIFIRQGPALLVQAWDLTILIAPNNSIEIPSDAYNGTVPSLKVDVYGPTWSRC